MYLVEALKVNGKVRRTSWINTNYHVIVDKRNRTFQGKDSSTPYWISLTFEEIIAEDWEPYKEPCKHEPKIDQSKIIFFQGKTEVKSKPIGEPWFYPECKHCGVKIQAKEWTAV